MENLKPKHREGISKGSNMGKSFLGPVTHVEVSNKKERKSGEEQGDVALSKGQTIFLSSLVIILSLVVGFLFIWIYNLQNENREKDLVIRNLRGTIASMEKEITEEETKTTAVATDTYSDIPSNVLPKTLDGLENPKIAMEEIFKYEMIFKESENIISEKQNITFYICNDKGALRLIRDSQLPYLIYKNSSEKYNLLLLGDYHPSWIEKLKDYEEKMKSDLLNSSTQPSTVTSPETAASLPEDLVGLFAEEMDRFWCIQILADSNIEKLNQMTGILKNEGIPAFLYSYQTSMDKTMYSMRIGFFSSYEEAEIYSKNMNRTQYIELIRKEIDNRFIKQMKLD